MLPIAVVAFGSSESSFYIGCGMRYHAIGVPNNLAQTLPKKPPKDMAWLSMDGTATAWILREKNRHLFYHSPNLPTAVVKSLKEATYVTLGPTKDWYFVGLGEGQWTANLPEAELEVSNRVRAGMGAKFYSTLTGIVFGKGATVLLMFQDTIRGFVDTEVGGTDLFELVKEHVEEGRWSLEPGSSICQWNTNFFYLIFKNKVTGDMKIRWNLPDTMHTKLVKLLEYTVTPQGIKEIEDYDRKLEQKTSRHKSTTTKDALDIGLQILQLVSAVVS